MLTIYYNEQRAHSRAVNNKSRTTQIQISVCSMPRVACFPGLDGREDNYRITWGRSSEVSALCSVLHIYVVSLMRVNFLWFAACRKGKGSVFKSHTRTRKGAVHLRKSDYAERHGYVKGVVKDIMHDPGRGAPLAAIQFKDAYRFQRNTELMVACEGMYTGQFIYCGKKGEWSQHQQD